MVDLIAVLVVISVGALFASLAIRTLPASVRDLAWLGFVEYIVASISQQLWLGVFGEGGDSNIYCDGGLRIGRMVDESFSFYAPEVLKLLVQQPSAFDGMVYSPGTNTGSMFAVAAILEEITGGSTVAAQLIIGCVAFIAATLVFKAFYRLQPDLDPRLVLLATAMFPSVAFWTSIILKEAMCFIGIGLALGGWQAIYDRGYLRTIVMLPLGVAMIVIFRAPTLPPLALGVALFLLWNRLRSARGADAVILGPLYLGMAFFIVAAGVILVSWLDPSLAVGKLADTLAHKQAAWASVNGTQGSGITDEDLLDLDVEISPVQQVIRAPLGLLNALFRPQFFDVHNIPTAISAIEMTVVSYLLLKAVRRAGFRGILKQIERSPLLLMCATITFVGCSLIGLATFNLGSLARYRVPFLPFYAMFIVILYKPEAATAVAVPESPAKVPATVPVRGSALGRPLARRG